MASYIKNSDGSYSVNYEDEKFKNVENERTEQEAKINNTYNDMINNSGKYYEDQIEQAKRNAEQQTAIQNEKTEFAINQIEQNKEQSQKDYEKEQKGSYVDYMKKTRSNEQNMANSGMSNTGYSESSEVAIYNAYQNRVATAKESLDRTMLSYNNQITQARLANNEILAEIANQAAERQLQLNQQAFEYNNSLILQRESALERMNEFYYQKYQDVLAQANNEIQIQMALDEIDRQYEQWKAEFEQQQRQWEAEFNQKKKQWEKEIALSEKQTNAQVAYYNAQIKALKSSSSTKSSSTLKTSTSSNPYNESKQYDVQTILSKMKVKQGPLLKEPIYDGISGKSFTSVDALLNYYGYAATNK